MDRYYNGYEVTEKQLKRIRLLREIVSDTSKRIKTQSALVEKYNNHPKNLNASKKTIDELPESNLKRLLSMANIYKMYHPDDIKKNHERKPAIPIHKSNYAKCYLCHDFINDDKKTFFDTLLEEVVDYIHISNNHTYLHIKTRVNYEKILADEILKTHSKIYHIDIGYGTLKITRQVKTINILYEKLDEILSSKE